MLNAGLAPVRATCKTFTLADGRIATATLPAEGQGLCGAKRIQSLSASHSGRAPLTDLLDMDQAQVPLRAEGQGLSSATEGKADMFCVCLAFHLCTLV